MNLREDLPLQGRAFLLALAMFLTGAASLVAGQLFLEQGKRAESAATAQRNDVRARLARMAEEETEIRAGDTLFQSLAAKGMIGEESRVSWIEHIARIRSQRRLYEIRWEISPRRPLETIPGATTDGFRFMASRLSLTMPLLHEADLLRFLDDLSASLPAYVRTRHCTLTRRPAGTPVGAPRLDAQCELDIITLAKLGEGK